MPGLTANEIQTQKHHRAFIQFGGALPTAPVHYAGPDAQYMEIGDTDNPVRGGTTSIQVHDPRRRGAYRRIGQSVDVPDLPSNSVSFYRRHGPLSRVTGDMTCPVNFYEVSGTCKRPDDFTNGWSDSVTVYASGQANGRSSSGRTSYEGDDASMDEIEFTYAAVYNVGALNFGETANIQVEREAIDVVYGNATGCGDCGTIDDGTKRIYVLTKSSGAGSPGTPAEVVYTIDGGATWSNVNITGLSGTADPTGIEIVGNYLVVLDTAGNGYYYTEVNALTGVPATWTQVTTGFVASKQPTDIYVIGANEVYFSANGGYVYRSTDIATGVTAVSAGTATTANLQRIHGDLNETIVAVGDSGAIVKSANRGATWSTATTSPTSATVRAVDVRDNYRFWIGTSGGKTYYTVNGGETWVEQSLPLGSTLTVVDDIVFATDEVGYVTARTSTPTARLLTTYNGGASWSSSATTTNPRIQNLPTFNRANRIGVPRDVDVQTMANNVALAGLSGGGTDGITVLGVAAQA